MNRQLQKSELIRLFRWLSQRARRKKPKVEPSQPKESEWVPMETVVEENRTLTPLTIDSVRALLRTAIADAEQVATSIKTMAQKEAEAEASRIIAQANLEAEEIKGKAEISAQREAENILSDANKKAQITEAETKQKALQFLIGVSEEVEKEIKEEYERAYARLASSLQALVKEGANNIDMDLKDKTARLGKGQSWLLQQFDASLLNPAGTTAPPSPETVVPDGIEVKSTSRETVAESVPLKEETLTAKAEEFSQLEKEVPVAEPAPPEGIVAEKLVEPVPPQPKATSPEPVAPLREELLENSRKEEKSPKEESLQRAGLTPVQLDSHGVYTGEVELVVNSPVELKLVSKLYNYLQTVSELRILYTRGSWDQGTTITVALDKPVPLISLLAEAPGMAVRAELLEKDDLATGKSSILLKGGEKKTRRINLNLKEALSP